MPNDKRGRLAWVRYYSVGFEFVAAFGVFVLLGYLADRTFDSSPYGILIGAVLGLVGGTRNLIKDTRKAFEQPAKPKRDDDRDPQAAKGQGSERKPPGES